MQLLDSEDDGKGRPGQAQQLILDTFMDGFLFELFRVKPFFSVFLLSCA